MALTTLIIHCSGNRRSITTLLSACTTHKVCWSFSLIFLVRIPFSVAYFCPFLSFFLLSLFPPPPKHFVFLELGTETILPFLSFQCIFPFCVGFFPWAIKFTLRDTHQFYSKHSQWFWFWFFFFLNPLAFVLFWSCVCILSDVSISLLSAHFLVKPFISEAGTPLKVSEAKMAFDTKAALVWNGREKCGQQHTSMSAGGCTRKKCQTKPKCPWFVGKNDSWKEEHRSAPKSRV